MYWLHFILSWIYKISVSEDEIGGEETKGVDKSLIITKSSTFIK